MIEVKNLEKSFGEQKVLNDVSLVCPNGEITGIIGHNGSGKTVLFKCICGLLFEDSGEILIDGKRYKSGGELIKNAGIIIENPAFLESESGINNLKYLFEIRNKKNMELLHEIMRMVGLDPESKKKVKNFSLGMKQRLALGVALLGEPEFLILDEPVNGLDPTGIIELRELLKKLKESGVSVLISSHILSELENVADRISIIDFGKMIEEINMKEWKNKQNSDIRVFVKEVDIAKKILFEIGIEEQNILEFSEGILIQNSQLSTTELNKVFVNNNIDLIGIVEDKTSLEDYFKKVTGGQGIG